MGNMIELPNINLDSVVDEEKPAKRESTFDVKNYLNIKLAEGEKEKTITIRLLPMNLETGSPFAKIHVHNVKVPQDMVERGKKPYKTYICLSKTEDIDHEKYGYKCPFCELNKASYNESLNESDPVKKKALQEISLENKSNEAIVVRCIERGNEDEGVKFWKFNIRRDKTDPYNQIIKLANMRKESAAKKGKVENILDIYEGKDLRVTITEEGTSAPTIVDESDRSPLSEDVEQMKRWIYDPKKWQDVFTCKPYDYLNLVSQMRIPWYDKMNGVWVDKEEFDKKYNSETKEIDDEIKNAKDEISKSDDKAKKSDLIDSITVNDNDLPF